MSDSVQAGFKIHMLRTKYLFIVFRFQCTNTAVWRVMRVVACGVVVESCALVCSLRLQHRSQCRWSELLCICFTDLAAESTRSELSAVWHFLFLFIFAIQLLHVPSTRFCRILSIPQMLHVLAAPVAAVQPLDMWWLLFAHSTSCWSGFLGTERKATSLEVVGDDCCCR